MENWLGDHHHHSNGTGNETAEDVTLKTCWAERYDQVACLRSSSLCFISAVTGVLAILRLGRLHLVTGPKNPHLLLLFYICSVHAFMGAVDWIWGWTTAGELACLYLRSLELLVVTHFYLTLTSRVFHCHTELVPRLLLLALSLAFVFFTTCAVVGLTSRDTPWVDCSAEYWLWIAAGHLVTIQVLLATSLLLTRKLNSVSAQAELKSGQKRQLWILLFAFETSALANLAYHLVIFLLAEDSCSQVFAHRQSEYSAVRAAYEILVFLLPIWAMLWVFRPSTQPPNATAPESDLDNLVEGALVPPSAVINWRESYGPMTFNALISPHAYSSQRLRLGSNSRFLPSLRRGRRFRRANSAPSQRKTQTPTSPPLATIPEESQEESSSSPISPTASSSFPNPNNAIPQPSLPPVSLSVDVHLP